MSATPQDAIDSVVAALETDTGETGVHTLVEGRIYEGTNKAGAANPMLIYNQITAAPDSSLVADGIDDELQIDIYVDGDKGAAGARVISEAVFSKLHRAALAISTDVVTSTCWVNCINRGIPRFDKGEYRLTQEYRIQVSS